MQYPILSLEERVGQPCGAADGIPKHARAVPRSTQQIGGGGGGPTFALTPNHAFHRAGSQQARPAANVHVHYQ